MTQIRVAGHLANGQDRRDYFYVGITAKIGDWYEWPASSADHRGEVRWGANGDNYGVENLRGQGKLLWEALMRRLVDAHPDAVEEVWFGPVHAHLGTMIRIHTFRSADREQLISA
ncbi:MAG TPA: hypothetical protein VLF67_03290, partial [Candidatus Saccharimonas sp.]|nr:hypothetical protein [Candidatus Saccharimonas sp.]